jgi:hypothetical protein
LLRLCPWWELRRRGAHDLVGLWAWEDFVPEAWEQPAHEHRIGVEAGGVIELAVACDVGEHIAPKAGAQDGRVDGLVVRVHHFDVPSGFKFEDPATGLARALAPIGCVTIRNFPSELVAEIDLLDAAEDVPMRCVAGLCLGEVGAEYRRQVGIVLAHGDGEIEFRLGFNLSVHPDGG